MRLFVFFSLLMTAAVSGAAVEPLRVAVGDPLAAQLACACVKGHAQRDYHRLAQALSNRLDRPVEVVFATRPEVARELLGAEPHLLIGKDAPVRQALGPAGVCLARLTDRQGATDFQGLLVVAADDPARTTADVAAGYRIVFGPCVQDEKHGAALRLLRTFGYAVPAELEVADSCNQAAGRLADAEGSRVAAVISDYAWPLLAGCGAVDEGALRIVGRTEPVPFVAVYATAALPATDRKAVCEALLAVSADPDLRRVLESRDGFVSPDQLPVESVAAPVALPDKPAVRWRRALVAQSLGGIGGAAGRVVVSDKDETEEQDVWRAFDAATGRPLWEIAYPAAGKMDYTGAPRATPVFTADGRVILLGAFGELVCADVADGQVIWRRNLLRDFGGKLPTWGFCGTPLLIGDRLIVQTAASAATTVALDRRTGGELWRAAGEGPGYGSLAHRHLGGRWQIVGHESRDLCGWDPATGEKRWKLTPPEAHDFNVPTPARVGDLLLAATENNGTRLYGFDGDGRILPAPVFASADLRPQISTPVLIGSRLWGQDAGGLHVLGIGRGLRLLGSNDGDAARDYAAFVVGADRLLVVFKDGSIALAAADALPATLAPRAVFPAETDEGATECWSAPLVLERRIYLRSQSEIVCLADEARP